MFVAFMLVIQAFLSGISLGATASTLDPSNVGGVICRIDGGTRSDEAPSGAPHEHHLDCCMFGCSMVGGATPSLAGADHIPPSRSILVGHTATPIERPVVRVELSPRLPRAPPASI